MAITTTAATRAALTGTTVTPVAANTEGNKFTYTSAAIALAVRINNASGGSVTVTLDDPNSVTPVNATAFNPDVAVTVGAGVVKTVVVSDLARFKQSGGGVLFTPSSATSVTLEPVEV